MAYAYAQQTWNTPRLVGFLVALGINVVLIIGLASGLVVKPAIFDDAPPPILLPPLDATKPLPPPVAPRDYVPERPTFDPLGPPPLVPIPMPLDPPIAVPDVPPDIGYGGGSGSGPVVIELKADAAYFVAPMYPPRSIALEEEGTVTLLLYVLPDGRVSDVRVAKSSGFTRLDNAALKTAKAKWRFFPRTQGGVAVAAWGTYAVKFTLE